MTSSSRDCGGVEAGALNLLLPCCRRLLLLSPRAVGPLLSAADAFEERGGNFAYPLSSIVSLPPVMPFLLEAIQGMLSCQPEAKMLLGSI